MARMPIPGPRPTPKPAPKKTGAKPAASKGPKKSPVVKGTKMTSGNLNRVTSNKPSIYKPGEARPGVDTGGNSNKPLYGGVRTEGGKVKADKYGSYYPKTTKNTPKKKK